MEKIRVHQIRTFCKQRHTLLSSVLYFEKNPIFLSWFCTTSEKLKTEGQFYHNKKTGKWVSYYISRKIKSVRNHNTRKLDGY